MTIERKLKDIILAKYGSMREFSKQIEMSQSTLATIMNRGMHNASIGNVIKICKALGISADELANDRIVPIDICIQNRTPMSEINDIISFTRKNIKDFTDLTIDGKPMTIEEIEVLLDGLELSIGIIKKHRERIYLYKE